MGDYGNYTYTTYNSAFGQNYNSSLTGSAVYTSMNDPVTYSAATTYTAGYPTSQQHQQYAAPSAQQQPTYTNSGTTYSSYALNNLANSTVTTPYVDWAAAAATAAAKTVSAATVGSKEQTYSSTTNSFKGRGYYNKNKSAVPKDPPKTYYCETCKVSCVGSQTYKEHCQGQRHKKKENPGSSTPHHYNKFGRVYKCELCDVSCTGEQAFKAHVDGIKHNKTVQLFKKLNKPVPSATYTDGKGETVEVDIEQVKELIMKKAEKREKSIEDGIERKRQAEERAKKRLEEIEQRKKEMEERRAKWEEERWKREEEWRVMQDQRDEEWKAWQEAEMSSCDTGPPANYSPEAAGFSLRPGTNTDNKLIMKVHSEIYPSEAELAGIQSLVKVTEEALKKVSDTMQEETEVELKAKGLMDMKVDGDEIETRVLKGCVRIGYLANGLLLAGDKHVEMLVFCTDKPTLYMLQNVKTKFEHHLTEPQKKALKVETLPEQSAFVVTDHKQFVVTVTLTASCMDEDITAAIITSDVAAKVLDRKNCVRVLSDLKRCKWFQQTISPTPTAVIALRLFRHFKKANPAWTVVSEWCIEVLVSRVIKVGAFSSKRIPPAEIMRRVLECISSGVLLPNGAGIKDPCADKDTDLAAGVDAADVEKLTMDAQRGLRLLVFNKLHEYLGVPEFTGTIETVPAEEAFRSAPIPPPHQHPQPHIRPYNPPQMSFMRAGPRPPRPMWGGRQPWNPPPYGRRGPYGGPPRHRGPPPTRKRPIDEAVPKSGVESAVKKECTEPTSQAMDTSEGKE